MAQALMSMTPNIGSNAGRSGSIAISKANRMTRIPPQSNLLHSEPIRLFITSLAGRCRFLHSLCREGRVVSGSLFEGLVARQKDGSEDPAFLPRIKLLGYRCPPCPPWPPPYDPPLWPPPWDPPLCPPPYDPPPYDPLPCTPPCDQPPLCPPP